MRFIIATILIVLYAFVLMATSKGFSGIGVLISYLVGGAILAPSIIAALFCIPKSGRNNKRFFRVFNIALLLSLLGSASSLLDIYGKPPQIMADPQGLIELTVPGNWSSEAPQNENVLLNLKDRSGLLNILLMIERAESDRLDLQDYAQLTGNQFQEIPNFVSKSDIEPCGTTQLACVYQSIETSEGEKGTITVLANLEGAAGFYSYIATTNPGLYDTYEKDIFEILASMHEQAMKQPTSSP